MIDPKISVIVPVYKSEPFIQKCIESILNQTYTNLEIILVDDGSPDRCGEICDAYAKRNKRIRVIHQENRGVSAARNAGLRLATGDWVGFVDDDDWIEPDMYEHLLSTAQKFDANVVQCAVYVEGVMQSEVLFSPEDGQVKHGLLKESLRIFSNSVWNKLYSAKVICNLSFDETCSAGEDSLFNAGVAQRTDGFVFIPEAKYHYNHRDSSASHAGPTVNVLLSIRQTSLQAVALLRNKLEAEKHFMVELLRNYMYICSKIVQFPQMEFQKIKSEIQSELRRKTKRIIFMSELSAKERVKLLLIAWAWGFYRSLLLASKKQKRGNLSKC